MFVCGDCGRSGGKLSDEDLSLLAALLTAIADQLALIAVCRQRTHAGPPVPESQDGD